MRVRSHSEAVVHPFIYQPDDAISVAHHQLTVFFKARNLFVAQVITHRLETFHSERNETVARLPPPQNQLSFHGIRIHVCHRIRESRSTRRVHSRL